MNTKTTNKLSKYTHYIFGSNTSDPNMYLRDSRHVFNVKELTKWFKIHKIQVLK